MKRSWALAAMALLLAGAAPVEPPDFETRLRAAIALYDGDRAAEALPILDAMLAETQFPAERGRIEQLRFFVLARLNRVPEARRAIETAVANTPEPTIQILEALFKIRAFMGDNDAAADTLILIASSDPAALNRLPAEMIGGVSRAIRGNRVKAFETDYALVVAGWSPPDATVGDLDWLRLRLVTALVAQDRLEEARGFMAAILNPVVLVRLGIDRRLAPLWPAIEAQLGAGADRADAAFVGAAKARFEAPPPPGAPKSLIARLGYAEALNIASREPEALALADVAKTPAEIAALSDREVWLVNLHAALLGDAGQTDAALARYAMIGASPVNGRTAIIGAIISRMQFAQSVDRPREALEAAAFAETSPAAGNAYGKAFIAATRACAQAQLGEKAAAEAVAAPLLAAPEANDDAYLGAMICLGRMDAAAAAIIRRLGSDDDRTEMLFDLQPFLINDRAGSRDARTRAALRTLKARADVKAAFVKAGRDLPAAVAPPR